MSNNSHDRQKDFPWFTRQNILIIGAGGIGSNLAFLLARINHKLYIYDHDVIEAHNLGKSDIYSILTVN